MIVQIKDSRLTQGTASVIIPSIGPTALFQFSRQDSESNTCEEAYQYANTGRAGDKSTIALTTRDSLAINVLRTYMHRISNKSEDSMRDNYSQFGTI